MKTLFFGAGPIGRLYACLLHEATADKRLRFTSPKLPSATSFIRGTLYSIGFGTQK